MIEAEERALMEETVRSALGEAVEGGAGAVEVDAVLAQLGWRDLLRDEPDDAIAIVFAALGATNAPSTALDDVMMAGLGREPRDDVAVLLPRFATWDPPGSPAGAEGLATARAGTADRLLVVGSAGPALSIGSVLRKEADVRAAQGIDAAAGRHAVRVGRGPGDAQALEAGAWQAAVALGRRAVAHEMLGASRTMLDQARSHALERTQFGKPVARFQAVRHRLAEAFVAAESLEATLGAAREEPNADTAALAKACAGRTAHTVARHCQQVLAGIGFTMEHRFHHFLKRTMALEGLLGSADAILLDVGRRLLAERRVPTLIEL